MNNVVLVGRLGKDPKVGTTKTNRAMAFFTLAVKDGKETVWFPVAVFGDRPVEFLRSYCHKGDLIGITGKLTSRQVDAGQYKKTEVGIVGYTVDKLVSGNVKDTASENTGNPASQYVTPEDLPF